MKTLKLSAVPILVVDFIISFLFLNSPLQANCSGNNETDRLALLEFKSMINIDPDGVLKSWNDSVHFCKWLGVVCDPPGRRVTSLVLHTHNLVGSLSPYIANLTSLRYINLINNSFYGEIPPQLGNLVQLQHLNFSANSFEGEIPGNLTRCSQLMYFLLEANNLRGNIPMDIGSLSKLKFLRVGTNNLTGWLPPSLGNLSMLINFGAAYNNLTGSIPASIGRLSSLRSITLGINQLSGSIPISFFNITSIITIAIPWNNLRGRLPEDMHLMMPHLVNFAISKNDFFATIPDSICNVSQLELVNMNRNNFLGKIPACLGNLRGLKWLDIAATSLGSNSTGDFTFLESLSNCSKLQRVGISWNNLGGPLPVSLGNLSTTLTSLSLEGNHITGSIPAGLGNLFNLMDLDMSYNHLTGDIPSYIDQFQNLQLLSLTGNQLSGQIPSSMGNLTRLSELYISQNKLRGNIPPTIGNCLQLCALDVSENRLSGAVPPQLMSLLSLSILLNLSNNLLTGNLPAEIGKLRNVNTMDLSNNHLTGEIPSTIGSCSSLEYLYMQRNFFNGAIPPALSSLKGLLELDLSQNNLRGEIPEDLLDIRLKSLNLSFNYLRGNVPQKGIFANATIISLMGNMLCGGVPELHLPQCSNKTTEKRRPPTLKRIVIIFSASLTVLFLVIVSSLLNYKLMRRSNKHVNVEDLPVDHFIKVSYTDLYEATNGYDSETVIGSGGIGTVYEGKLKQIKAPVAIKVLNLQHKKAYKRLVAECNTTRTLRHRNLVKIVSYCSSTDNQGKAFGALVYEFVGNGSLDKWLHGSISDGKNQSHHLSLLQRLNIAIDVASALHYLHDLSVTSTIHCNLKPSNVLLDEDMVAHVSDFGLARLLAPSEKHASTICLQGMVGYAPPEYGMGSTALKEGDVYSYGILLLEMLSGKRPTDDMFKDGMNLRELVKAAFPKELPMLVDPSTFIYGEAEGIDEETVEPGETTEATIKEKRGMTERKKVEDCLKSLLELGVRCSAESPRERLNMEEVTRKLHSIRIAFLAKSVSPQMAAGGSARQTI